MHCHVEEFESGGVIRVFAEGQEFPGPYLYAFPFRRRGNEIEIVGINSRAPSKDECWAMLQAAKEQGWDVWAKRGRRVRRWHLERIAKLHRPRNPQQGVTQFAIMNARR